MKRVLCAVAVLLSCLPLLADGFFLGKGPRTDAETAVDSPGQKGMVIRAANGWELLVVQPDYHGPAEEFAWIVPVPVIAGKDILREVSPALLEGALKATQPEVIDEIHRPGDKTGPGTPAAAPGMTPGGPGGPPASAGVQVIQITDVGPYRAALLTATGAGGLLAWLGQNGYGLPARAEPVLAPYIQRHWGFVALKLRSPTAGAIATLKPLGIYFPSAQLIYPLAITRISSAPRMSLLLLVVDRQGVTCPTLTTLSPFTETSLPLGSLYGSYRRQVAWDHPEGALLREAVLMATDTAFNSLVGAVDAARQEPGQEWLADVCWWQGMRVTRFFGYLPRERLQDLVFTPDTIAGRYVALVTREGWEHAPWFYRGVPVGWGFGLLGVISLLVVVLWRRREGTWSPLTVWLAAIIGAVAVALPGFFLRDQEQAVARFYLPALGLGLVLSAAACVWVVARSARREQDALIWRLVLVSGCVAVPAVLLAANISAGHLGQASALAALALASLLTAVVLGSAPMVWMAWQQGVRLPLGKALPAVELALLLGLSWSVSSMLAQDRSHHWYVYGALRHERGVLRAAAQDYYAKRGAYPQSVTELCGYGGPEVVLPGEGAPWLHGPLRRLPRDPLTGKRDTWVIDPLDPGVVDSGGWQVRVQADQLGRHSVP